MQGDVRRESQHLPLANPQSLGLRHLFCIHHAAHVTNHGNGIRSLQRQSFTEWGGAQTKAVGQGRTIFTGEDLQNGHISLAVGADHPRHVPRVRWLAPAHCAEPHLDLAPAIVGALRRRIVNRVVGGEYASVFAENNARAHGNALCLADGRGQKGDRVQGIGVDRVGGRLRRDGGRDQWSDDEDQHQRQSHQADGDAHQHRGQDLIKSRGGGTGGRGNPRWRWLQPRHRDQRRRQSCAPQADHIAGLETIWPADAPVIHVNTVGAIQIV